MGSRWLAIVRVGVLSTALLLSAAGQAADGTWAFCPLVTRGVAPDVALTFTDLLKSELTAQTGASFADAPTACQDVPCAVQAGRDTNTGVALYGALSSLGAKIIVTVTSVDVARGEAVMSHRLTATNVEDLEAVATRIAKGIATGKAAVDTVELGTVTEAETKPDRRREGDHGFGLRIGGVAPLAGSYASAGFGVLIDTSYVYEARDFAIEPRVGARFAAERKNDANFVQIPIDLGAYYILGSADIAFLAGGGCGVRYHWQKRPETVTVGSAIQTVHRAEVSDDAWGFGLFGRIGGLFFRTYTVRMTLSIDYDISFVTLHGHRYPMALTFGAGIVL